MQLENPRCFFTQGAAKQDGHLIDALMEVTSESCGKYYVTDGVYFQLTTVKDGKNYLKPLTQGHANCAHETLRTRKENPKSQIIWALKEEVDEERAKIERKRQTGERGVPDVTILNFDEIFKQPINHSTKASDLLDQFAAKLAHSGAYEEFTIDLQDLAWAKIKDVDELWMLITHLAAEKLLKIEGRIDSNPPSQLSHLQFLRIRMTVSGWKSVNEKNSFPNTNKVFIATAFKWPEEAPYQREESTNAIKSACKSLGYEADIVHQNHTENITDKIIAGIKNSRFIVCELTYNNRGAYYEAGYARGIERPVFHVVHESCVNGPDSEGRKIHFDIQQIMYRKWTTPADLEIQLRNWIEATIGRFK